MSAISTCWEWTSAPAPGTVTALRVISRRRRVVRSVGHKGKFGHEFMEFELRPDGRLRYANNSNYKKDTIIRKEVRVSPTVLAEFKRIIAESEIIE